MNLTLHILRKDFRRLRLPLLLWTGLLTAHALLCMRLFSSQAGDVEWFEFQSGLIFVLTVIGWIFTFVLAAAFVLEDPLVGTQMFWATRPISGGRLLAAKAGGIFVALVLWPVVVALPSWVYCGLSRADLIVAAWRIVMVQLPVCGMAFALAGVAGQGSRFLLWTLGSLAAWPLALGVITYHARGTLSADVVTSRWIVVAVIIGVTALAVILLQYLGRRVTRTVAVLAAGLALAAMAGLCWQWNLIRAWRTPVKPVAGSEAVEVAMSRAQVRPTGSGDEPLAVSLVLRVDKIPAGLRLLNGVRYEAEFRWADGTTLEADGKARIKNYFPRENGLAGVLPVPPARPDPETEAKLAELRSKAPVRPAVRSAPEPPTVEITHLLAAKWAQRFRTEAPVCTVRLHLATSQPRLAAQVRFVEGDDRIGDGGRLRVLRYGDEYRADPQKPRQKNLYLLFSNLAQGSFIDVYEIDHVRGRTGWVLPHRGAGILLNAGLLPVSFHWQFIGVPYPRVWRNDRWVEMPDWFDDSTLAVVTFPETGGFEREVEVDRLAIVE